MDPLTGIVGIDLESCSYADIDVGSWAYSRHESTRIWCVSWTYFEGNATALPVQRWHPGEPLDPRLIWWVQNCGTLLAHNAGFEQSMWQNILAPLHGWPMWKLHQWRDSQTRGLAVNLPSKLEGLARYTGGAFKDAEGHALMKRKSKATRTHVGYRYPSMTPEELERLGLYCDRDVLAMIDAWRNTPEYSPDEYATRRADQAINDRGVYLDKEFARKMQELVAKRGAHLAKQTAELTYGKLENSTATPALKEWVKSRGVKLPKVMKQKKGGPSLSETLDKTALQKLLDGNTIDPVVRQVFLNRQEANKITSLAKLERVHSMTTTDGRLRNSLQYGAADTGRWASYGLQVHNLRKNHMSARVTKCIEYCVETGNYELLCYLEDKPLDALSQMLRLILSAPPGFDLIAADYSAIEARVVAWLAGADDVVDFFHRYDHEMRMWAAAGSVKAEKPQDYYEFTAAGIGSDDRQLGKVCALALGYGMGDVTFHSTANGWGVPLELLEARSAKRAWRETNQTVVRFWEECETAAKAAIRAPGQEFWAGRLMFVCTDTALLMRLPSGRLLHYWQPSVQMRTQKFRIVEDDGTIVEKEQKNKETICFWSVGKDKETMVPDTTYGGKLVENGTQACARDLLGAALPRLERAGYPVVVHVHDSAAAQVVQDTGSVDQFSDIMAELPAWAQGLPVACDGYRGKRFAG